MKRLRCPGVDRTDYIVGPITFMSYPRFKALSIRDVCSLEFMWSDIAYRTWDLSFNLYRETNKETEDE